MLELSEILTDDEEDLGGKNKRNNALLIFMDEYLSNKSFKQTRLSTEDKDHKALRLFGIHLSALRRRHNLSLYTLASKTNTSLPELASIELGRTPRHEVLGRIEQISKALMIDPLALHKQISEQFP